MIELPLTFGTITVITILLLLVTILAKYIIDLVLFGFKFLLNQDHPNAIKIDVANPLNKVLGFTIGKVITSKDNIYYCKKRKQYCVLTKSSTLKGWNITGSDSWGGSGKLPTLHSVV